jgi:hypothetical protein
LHCAIDKINTLMLVETFINNFKKEINILLLESYSRVARE